MSHEIPAILQTLGLGTEAKLQTKFNPECVVPPVKLSKAKNVVRNLAYEAPTPADIAHFKDVAGMSTGELCRIYCVDRRKMNSYISQRGYEKGARLPSSIWASALESAELIPRLKLKPKFADIRDEVLRTSQAMPTKHELYLIQGLSGLSIEEISDKTGIELGLLKTNIIRGTIVFDEDNQYVAEKAENQISRISTTVTSLSREQWATLRDTLGVQTPAFVTLPPIIRARTLSANTDPAYSTAKGRDVVPENDSAPELPSIVKELGESSTESEFSEYDFEEDTPYFRTCHSVFEPPEPRELRQIAFWTGFSLRELALIMDISVHDLKFLMSHYAINHRTFNKRTGKEGNPKTKHLSYYQWRRLLEVFNLVEPIKFSILR